MRRSIPGGRSLVVIITAALLPAGCLAGAATPEPLVTSPSSASPLISPAPVATHTTAPTPPSPEPTSGPAIWTDGGDLVEMRGNARLAITSGGLAVVVGNDVTCAGIEPFGSSVRTEVRDSSGAWWEAESLPSPRDRFAMAALPDGRVLVTGGLVVDADGVRSYSSTYLLDPISATWSKSGLMTTARYDPAFTSLLDGRVLVVGGTYFDLPDDPPARVLRSAELFDPATETWTRTGNAVHARSGARAVTLADGRVLVVGGTTAIDPQDPLASTIGGSTASEVWDSTTGAWTETESLGEYREGFALVALADGGALVLGGRTRFDAGEFGTGVLPTKSVERWDPRTGRWSPAADMAIEAAERAAVRLPDGRVLVAGGDVSAQEPDLDVTPDAYVAAVEIFDPSSAGAGTWSDAAPLPEVRAYGEAVVLANGSVLVATGFDAPPEPEDAPACPRATSATWVYGVASGP